MHLGSVCGLRSPGFLSSEGCAQPLGSCAGELMSVLTGCLCTVSGNPQHNHSLPWEGTKAPKVKQLC